jgi:DNA-binding transcriptional LysR family regulator
MICGRDGQLGRPPTLATPLAPAMNLAAVDLNLLVVFEAMMRERNVSRGARRVGIAQPSMSNALRRLRELFDDELFVRTPSEMRPTPKAFELARPINEALHQVRFALKLGEDPFDRTTSTRTFWIAGVDFADTGMVPESLAMIRREAPNVAIATKWLSQSEAIECLDNGTIDIAVGSFTNPPKRLGVLLLREEAVECVMRQDHPASAGEWTAERFATLPHLVVSHASDTLDPIDAALAERGLKRTVVARLSSDMLVPFVIRDTDLVACVSEGVARLYRDIAGLAFRAPPVPLPARRVSMAWSRNTENAFGLQWLRERIIEVARQHRERLRQARPDSAKHSSSAGQRSAR